MPNSFRSQPWRFVILAVAGLLASVGVAGVLALVITTNVGQVADRALRNDIELEDRADDLRVAVLDVRHFHRNLVFLGPTRTGLAEFEDAFQLLMVEIEGLKEVDIIAPGAPQPDELRQAADRYYADFRPAIDLFTTDPVAFVGASDQGLSRLESLESRAQELDRLGEQLAAGALRNVNEATSTATLVLIIVLAGVGAAGAGLAYAAIRVLRELRSLYAGQQDTTARLEQALRAKMDFVADASHELRTPLTVLRGNAEVGLMDGPVDCGHRQVLQEIVDESSRMTRLVEDLLLLARSDAGTVPLDVRTVELEPWLAEVAARAEILARDQGAVLAPSLGSAGSAMLDPERIEQVLRILVDNAAKYGPADNFISMTSQRRGAELVIEVSDRGSGIPEAELPIIFERFYRVDKVRVRKQGGAGLGLSIARAIVEGHGGRIEATSRMGQGTKVIVALPVSGPGSKGPLDAGSGPAVATGLPGRDPMPDPRPKSREGVL